MKINIRLETNIQRTPRVQQLESLFDVPAAEKLELNWKGDLPIDNEPWNIGLIVGPSGCGKSTILRENFGAPAELSFDPLGKTSVVDDFNGDLSMADIAQACQAVGFNTIPAWMRPFNVLSNGEKFRVEIARRLLEDKRSTITIDEFTSVVDRQVAKITAFAVQRFIRHHDRRLVAASCHYDIIEWLDPDWILEPSSMTFTRRRLWRPGEPRPASQRPPINVEIGRVPYSAWARFRQYHYMSAELNHAARCFGLFVNDTLTSFAGVLHRPHAKTDTISGISRVVTLPDWQGLGLAMVLLDTLGAAYAGVGKRLHNYPAHPSFIRSHLKSPKWLMVKAPGTYSPPRGESSSVGGFGGRLCAVFSYIGAPMESEKAKALLGV